MKNLMRGFVSCFILSSAILFSGKQCGVYAEEIVLLYTGDTHGMIYHCGCPIEPDGGIARRASLVKELRNKHKNVLLLDSGAFFGGGVMDEYSQNESLDKERTRITLKGLEVMKYDALALADDEFNFGKKFLIDSLAETKLPVLSCNVFPERDRDIIKPFIIKKIDGISVGIIGVTTMQSGKKAEGFKILNHI
ncbi:MAG: hypothetical protein PHE58_06905, partial [Candidatus Omnitrophica bacterium]|nr:hypothetical protein [Candidatus Omnitrophota bacterium]